MSTITVITPTYNRAHLLPNAYKSLVNQTCHDFQWLVIDDGSTDNTKVIINNYINENNNFEIEYHYKENGGKHTALNESHKYIKGEYCFVLDSDDILVSKAIEKIIKSWNCWKESAEVGRIIFLKAKISNPNEVICYAKKENTPIDTVKNRYAGKLGIDCCDTFRTSIFTKYKFPIFAGEKFIGEGSGWFPIELETKAVYINDPIYLCEYLDNGLTRLGRKMRIQNPLGGMYNSKMYMNSRLPLKKRIKKGILYSCYSKFANMSFKKTYRDNPYKLMMIICYIPGCILYVYWKNKYLK